MKKVYIGPANLANFSDHIEKSLTSNGVKADFITWSYMVHPFDYGEMKVFRVVNKPPFTIFGKNIFDILDYSASNVMLPLGGLLIVLFVGWFAAKGMIKKELSNDGSLRIAYYPIFAFIVKFIAPLAIAAIFIYSIFWGGLG